MEQIYLTKKVGQNLKKLLKKESITYEQFAELMVCDPRTVGRWIQNGISDISTLERIASIFQIEVQDIMCYDED